MLKHIRKRNNLLSSLILIALSVISFFWRFYALNLKYSFWNDEHQTAIFARAILDHGFPVLSNGYTPTIYLPFWYYLPALSMKFIGVSEMAARLPSVIFGSLTIWAVFLLGKQIFNKNVGLMSALLVTFLKIEILWSRQARPYQLVQLLYILAFYFFLRFLEKFDRLKEKNLSIRDLVWTIILSLLAAAVHPLGLLLFVYFGVYLVFFRWDIFREIYRKFNKIVLLLTVLFLLLLLWRLNIFVALRNFVYGGWGETIRFYNCFYYYRVFLSHNYLLISLFSFLGLILALIKKIKINILFFVLLVIHIGFISFRLNQPFVRYLYPIFPFIIIFAVYGLWRAIFKIFKKEKVALLFIILLLFSFMFFDSKFALKPQSVYSLNEDMQEIPEVDYQRIYGFVKGKLNEYPEAVYVSNWNDHAVWYLGEGNLDYLLRLTSSSNQKDPLSGAVFVQNLEALKEIINKNQKGLILLESWESELPQGTKEYIKSNLKKELEVDRLYSVQPRLWPVEVYSWGI